MDCKDLMIGDWVSYKGDPPYIVRGTSICKVVTIDNGIDHRNVMDDAINPIPLTEEILAKNGFVYREEEETCATDAFHHWQLDGHWFALNSTQYFRKEKKDDMPRFDVAGIAIHYVHQLQHLLRLCGINKEIEL